MDPVKFVEPNAVERQSGVYTATLKGENGVPLPYTALNSFTLTLYDRQSGVIINGRNQQNALNTNQVTVDLNGVITWTWLPADMPVLVPTRDKEEHVAMFEAKWTDGSGNPRQANHEVHFFVNRIPQVV